MKKALMIGILSLGLMSGAMAASNYDGCSQMTYVTQMDLKGNRITKNDVPLLETLLRMGKMGYFVLEVRYGQKSKPQAILVSSWLKDQGFDRVSIREDEDIKSGVYLYAANGCGTPTPRTSSVRNISESYAGAGAVAKGQQESVGNVGKVFKWDEGERLSTVVMRWTGRNVSPVMDATIKRGGQFTAKDANEAVEKMLRATGCSIQMNVDPIVVDCSGQQSGAK